MKLDKSPHTISALFDQVASRYGLMNACMTLGRASSWSRRVARIALQDQAERVLDLAAGRGELARALLRQAPQLHVVAADFSAQMVRQGKRLAPHAAWVMCDARRLPFPDHQFDAVVMGYLLRNVDQPSDVLRSVWRVLRPGGRLVCLDTCPPPPGLLGAAMRLYLKTAVPLMARCLSSHASAYSYLTVSTQHFEAPQDLAARLENNGWIDVGWSSLMLGAAAIHHARKPLKPT